MEDIYQINPQLDIPIYQQLVDTIRTAVKKGILAPNQQLPTVSELSEKLDITPDVVSRVENGYIAPRFGRIEQIAIALDCSVSELFREKNAISQAQYTKSLGDLIERMEMRGVK